MGFGQAPGDLADDGQRFGGVHPALPDALAQFGAFEQLHRHIEALVGGLAHIEKAHGVRMRELRDDAGFAEKAHDDARIHRKHRRQHFHRDAPIDVYLTRDIDLRHAACGQK